MVIGKSFNSTAPYITPVAIIYNRNKLLSSNWTYRSSSYGLITLILGEIFELKAELNSDKKDRKKDAVKKVIASMTVGKDVRYDYSMCC